MPEKCWPKSITLETQQVHQYLNSHLGCTLRIRRIYHSQTLTDLPLTQSSLVDGSGQLFSIEIVQKYEISRRLVSCEKEQPHDVEKCMWSWHYCHFVGSTTAKKPQFRWCCSIPKMDSKDGLHPKLIHTLGVFPVNPLELQTMVNLRSLSKRLFFSWLIHFYHW